MQGTHVSVLVDMFSSGKKPLDHKREATFCLLSAFFPFLFFFSQSVMDYLTFPGLGNLIQKVAGGNLSVYRESERQIPQEQCFVAPDFFIASRFLHHSSGIFVRISIPRCFASIMSFL